MEIKMCSGLTTASGLELKFTLRIKDVTIMNLSLAKSKSKLNRKHGNMQLKYPQKEFYYINHV